VTAFPSPAPFAAGATSGVDLLAAPAASLAAPATASAAGLPRSAGVVIRATRVRGIRAAYGAFLVALLAALVGAFASLGGGMKTMQTWLAS
jgi:hypothetical protein